MAKKIIKCPHCGEETQIDDLREVAFCSCCGTKLIVKDILGLDKEIQLDDNNKLTTEKPVQESSRNNIDNRISTNNAVPPTNGKDGKFWYFVIGIFAFVFIIVMARSCGSKSSGGFNSTPTEGIDTVVVDTAMIKDKASSETSSYKKTWDFTTDIDEMTDSKNIWATLVSDNSIKQEFPYDITYGKITVRYMKKYGYDVLVQITSGQIHGSAYSDDNYVMVRFDKDKPIKYWFDEPADNSSDCIFIRKKNDFITRCKKAKTIKVEIPLYQAGRPVFEFHVDEPLKWEQ